MWWPGRGLSLWLRMFRMIISLLRMTLRLRRLIWLLRKLLSFLKKRMKMKRNNFSRRRKSPKRSIWTFWNQWKIKRKTRKKVKRLKRRLFRWRCLRHLRFLLWTLRFDSLIQITSKWLRLKTMLLPWEESIQFWILRLFVQDWSMEPMDMIFSSCLRMPG